MMNDQLFKDFKPETISGIKRLAKELKKRQGLAHMAALDVAAVRGGWQNYRHAFNSLTALENSNG